MTQQAADQGDFEDTEENLAVEANEDLGTLEEQVSQAIESATTDDEGNMVLPDDLDPNVKYAAGLEKRRRDTQSSYEKSQHQLRTEQAKSEKLEERLLSDPKLDLSDEEALELEELKNTDADAWRNKLNEHTATAKAKAKEDVDGISNKTENDIEVDRRQTVLDEFHKANPELTLTDEVIENDLPPRILKQLESGEVTFEKFLDNAKNFLTKGKVIQGANEEDENDPDLGELGGTDKVTDRKIAEDIIESYKDEIF